MTQEERKEKEKSIEHNSEREVKHQGKRQDEIKGNIIEVNKDEASEKDKEK